MSEDNFGVLKAPPLPSLIDILASLVFDAAIIQHRNHVLGNALALCVKVDTKLIRRSQAREGAAKRLFASVVAPVSKSYQLVCPEDLAPPLALMSLLEFGGAAPGDSHGSRGSLRHGARRSPHP